MPPTKHDLLQVLATHIGRANGAAVEDLAARLDTHARLIRTLVTALRMDGIAVCGTPGTGYFIAATAEEIEQSCAFLRARAMHSLALEARLRKLPLPDLIGQLHLRT